MATHRSLVKTWIKSALYACSQDCGIFQSICDRIEVDTSRPATNIRSFSARSTTQKGNYFEALCALYLEAQGYVVYTLKELSPDLRRQLHIPQNDFGIDLIAYAPPSSDTRHPLLPIAVQCKYRAIKNQKTKYRPHGKTALGWKELSTFMALCERTGPWKERLVMTSADFASFKGMKDNRDRIIAKQTWINTPRATWLCMAGVESNPGHVLGSAGSALESSSAAAQSPPIEKVEQKDNARERRAAHFEHLLSVSKAAAAVPKLENSRVKTL